MYMLLTTLRRNRMTVIAISYIIMLIFLIYLLAIGYETTIIVMGYSKKRADAKENGSSEDDIKQINSDEEDELNHTTTDSKLLRQSLYQLRSLPFVYID